MGARSLLVGTRGGTATLETVWPDLVKLGMHPACPGILGHVSRNVHRAVFVIVPNWKQLRGHKK